jgi:hypothetical protein
MHLHSLSQDLVAHMLQTALVSLAPVPTVSCLAPSSRWGETTTTMSTQGHQVTPPYHAGRVGGYNGLTMSQVPGPEISAHLARSIWPCAICIYIWNLTPSVSLCGPSPLLRTLILPQPTGIPFPGLLFMQPFCGYEGAHM